MIISIIILIEKIIMQVRIMLIGKELKSQLIKIFIDIFLCVNLFINQQLTNLFQHPIITLLHHRL